MPLKRLEQRFWQRGEYAIRSKTVLSEETRPLRLLRTTPMELDLPEGSVSALHRDAGWSASLRP